MSKTIKWREKENISIIRKCIYINSDTFTKRANPSVGMSLKKKDFTHLAHAETNTFFLFHEVQEVPENNILTFLIKGKVVVVLCFFFTSFGELFD